MQNLIFSFLPDSRILRSNITSSCTVWRPNPGGQDSRFNGDEHVKSKIAQVGIKAISVSILTVGELYFGAYNSKHLKTNLERISEFLSSPGPIVLSFDDAAAKYFGKFKAALRRDGKPIGDIDLLIAGIDASRNLKVVTNNTEHFERLPDISLENWLKSSNVSF